MRRDRLWGHVREWPLVPSGPLGCRAGSLTSRTLESCEESGLQDELAPGTPSLANAHIHVLPGARVLVLFLIEIKVTIFTVLQHTFQQFLVYSQCCVTITMV